MNGNAEMALQLIYVVLKNATNLLDKINVYDVKIQVYNTKSELPAAIDTTLDVLKQLGVDLPRNPSKLNIILELAKIKLKLLGKPLDTLYQMPEMTDAKSLVAMRIMNTAWVCIFIGLPNLFPILVFQQINLSLKYGNSPFSAIAYSTYGLICATMGDLDSAEKSGQLALDLLEKLNANSLRAKVIFFVATFIKPWIQPCRSTRHLLQSGLKYGLEVGDLEYALYCSVGYIHTLVSNGNSLQDNVNEMRKAYDLSVQYKQEMMLRHNAIHWQATLNLLEESQDPCQLNGTVYQEETLPIQLAAKDNTGIFYVYLHKLILCYLFGSYCQAINHACDTEKYLESVQGSYYVVFFYFYDSLARLAGWNKVSKTEKKLFLSKVKANHKKMKRWADYAPINNLHKFYLVEAELYRVLGNNIQAAEYYDRALTLAKENEYLPEVALASELAANFYLAWGKERISRDYLINAYYAYARWGAKAKIDDLEKRYPQLLFLRDQQKRQFGASSRKQLLPKFNCLSIKICFYFWIRKAR